MIDRKIKVKGICPKCIDNGRPFTKENELEYIGTEKGKHYYKCAEGHKVEIWEVIKYKDRLEVTHEK